MMIYRVPTFVELRHREVCKHTRNDNELSA